MSSAMARSMATATAFSLPLPLSPLPNRNETSPPRRRPRLAATASRAMNTASDVTAASSKPAGLSSLLFPAPSAPAARPRPRRRSRSDTPVRPRLPKTDMAECSIRGGGAEPSSTLPTRRTKKQPWRTTRKDGRSPTARGGAIGKTQQANKQNDAMSIGDGGIRPTKKGKTRGRSEDNGRCDPHMGRSCTGEHKEPPYRYRRWKSRANFDGNAPPSVGDVLAGGQNTPQDSPLCLRRTPCCFRRDDKGVEMLELHYQYRRC